MRSRLPALGARGQGWVALQGLLIVATGLVAALADGWPGAVATPLRAGGALLVAAGAALALAGARGLGGALTPLPRPRAGTALRERAIYGRCRHPIYGGIMLAAAGVALLSGPLALLPAGALALLLHLKAQREEAWLRASVPGYEAYAARVRRRYVPGA